LVLLVVLGALLLGWLLKNSIGGSTAAAESDGLSLRYPGSWVLETGRGEEGAPLVEAMDLRSGSSFPTTVRVEQLAVDDFPQVSGEENEPIAIANAWGFQRAMELDNYQGLNTELVQVDGHPGASVDYAYVETPAPTGLQQALPVVVRATDYLIPVGDQVYILTLAVDATRFEEASTTFDSILQSVRFESE
jgi:hypothetical protein